MIRFKNVELGYGSKILLTNVDFEIKKGDFIGIVGPNGSGKTTFLKTILGMIPNIGGEIIKSKDIQFGYVPQRSSIDTLFPLTVFDFVFMGMFGKISSLQHKSKELVSIVADAIFKVGLTHKQNDLFQSLSGGQQQRILLARALVAKPEILILDEPTNGLDIAAENSIMTLIETLHKESNLTVILVSHFLHLVSQHAKQIGLIHERKFNFGNTNDLLTTESLTQMYGSKIQVKKIEGKTVILT